MLYNILSKLFKQDELQARYTPYPIHLSYSLLLMGTGTVSMFQNGWIMFGVITFILGALLGLTIIIGMNWDKIIEYWQTINEHIAWMNKVNNPELWYALGYKQVPQSIQVIEQEDKGQGFITTRINNLPISPVKMNQLANKVLGSGRLDFTEEEYGRLIPNFRQFRKDWITQGKLVQKNKNNKRSGYVLSRKGLQVIYEFASDTMKLKEGKINV